MPQYKHDCDGCIFLGTHGTYDLYICPNKTYFPLTSLIARYGNIDSEYRSSHPPEAFAQGYKPQYWEQLVMRLAREKGLVK